MGIVRLVGVVFVVALAVGGCRKREEKPLVELRSPPLLCPEGYQLILDFEVGGGEGYYTRHLARPSWPGGSSGVTVGVGYDLGYNTPSAIISDWQMLPPPQPRRLGEAAGICGTPAKEKVPSLRDIVIGWPDAETVFQRVSLVRFTELTRRTYPGFDRLHPKAQAALVSLTFNRGSGMLGERRKEMREIRDCVARQDYAGMAYWNRASIRVWKGTSLETGMRRRREAEARLMESAAAP